MDKIIIVIVLLATTNAFYTYLTPQKSQCFYNHIFKDQSLLIEVEAPIISLKHKIMLTVTNNNNTLLEWDIVNNAKITVPRTSSKINDENSTDSMEHQSCFTVTADQSVKVNETDDQNPVREKRGYFVHVKFMTNFNHKLVATQERAQQQLTNINYIELSKAAAKLKQINKEQISLHQINEVKQKLSQFYLQGLKGRVIVFSMIEILVVVVFTVLQLKMMRGYVGGLSVV